VSFLLYVIGFVVFITGLAWLATIAGIPQAYILAAAALMLCAGIFAAAARARSEGSA
jgi:apolipoprotein N-acyltransferase